MKIVCLVKQIVHPAAVEFDPETKALRREGVPLELNPFDRAAVEHAVRLREQSGGEVVAMTMGPPQAEEALRETLALGADRCIHLSDRVFAVADTLGTSRTLALAIRKEGADLVVCGRKTLDSETWQVPPEVAAFLSWPQLTSAFELELHDGRLRATQETDEGEERYEVELPAVVSVARPSENAPARPVSDGTGRIALWTARDLVSDLRPNDRRFGQAGSPTRVLAVRDATPARAAFRAASALEAADRVRSLLAERPAATPSWEKPPHAAEIAGARFDCWTVVEAVDGRAARVSLELLGRGRHLSGKLGGRNVALVVGHRVGDVSAKAARYGADAVFEVDDPALSGFDAEVWAAALRQVVSAHRPHVLLIGATIRGRDFGARLAGELEVGMTGDCVAVDIAKAGRLLQTKPAFGGNIVSVIMGSTNPQVATVRPRMYEPLTARESVNTPVEHVRVERLAAPRTRLLERGIATDAAAHDLNEAPLVVVAGAGVGGADSVSRLSAIARAAGGSVGGTREACAAGLLARTRQVGLYGRAVAPRLLVAVEVPGDFEHLTGFVKADVVVALDRAADTEMLAAADVALVGDWRETLPALLEGGGFV